MGSEGVVSKIPVVELSSEKLKLDSNSWKSACQEARQALEKYGCCELVYDKHDIEASFFKSKRTGPEFHNSIFEAMEEFFSLPREIIIKNTHRDFGHAYVYNGKCSIIPISENLRIENGTDIEEWQNFTRLMWPRGNQHFCETAHSYSMLLAEVQEVFVKMLCESYGIEKEYIESHLKSTSYLTAFNKYKRSNQGDTNIGAVGHTDKSFLTVLHQNHVNGLEVRLNNGEDDQWNLYQPSSSYSSFIVLAGDACTGWSNDRIKSCYHRVMVEGEEVRYTIGSFSFVGGLVQAPKELIDEEHPLNYKPFDQRHLPALCNCNTDASSERTNFKAFYGI
ncbi:2-oxoglutarate (2OG) and Fe(II)-dependent oxygenase superfamily protein [Euphorbia peplus]|nr:2-oxoglutarate (2OG) and Fe(II)-dependent oxygenase superfamily protein [Euphorbia peplus]